jgi:SAM-dependent methyltransferase
MPDRPPSQDPEPPGAVWKKPAVAAAFLERSRDIPDRPRQLEAIFRVLGLAERPPARVLDLGCGDGLILDALLAAFPEAEGVGLDFSAHMLAQAATRLARFGTRARTVEADLAASSWRNAVSGRFDAVVSGFAIHHLAHRRKRALFDEIHDLLAEGGLFLDLEHVASASPRLEAAFDTMMGEHLFACRRARGEAVTLAEVHEAYVNRPDREANILAPVEVQCGWLREIGFTDVDCYWKYFELALFGGFRRRTKR